MKGLETYAERFLNAPLEEIDPFVNELIGLEETRQGRKIILIPSESICPRPVREALASPFGNVYAEGYPPSLMDGATEQDIRDLEWQLINYRRYADRRFYKGCEYVHEVESLAKWRIAECFATPECAAECIHVNVQPLSGAAANNAVYDAFLEPGDVLMGMALPHGGHLTHGSEFNRSGKSYRVVSYGVRTDTERLDYEEIRRLAREHRPRLIVAGYTSYPWAPDWEHFREIADEVGAVLLADIAHPAGLVVAGLYPTPVGIADVMTLTTHKTLCGPRGAVILTTDPDRAQMVDSAVFPGEQGGPHVNKMAAMAVAFGIAQTEAFRDLQRRIVENAKALAAALDTRGVRVCYGGTDTHLLVVDLRKLGQQTGYPLMGEIAVRMLDLAGMVANKNTIPGDLSAADARGIRMGTPWVSQRGMGPEEMERIADIIHRLLSQIHPFTYQGVTYVLPRGKLPMEVLEEARRDVQDLLEGLEPGLASWGYPHDHGLQTGEALRTSVLVAAGSAPQNPPHGEIQLTDQTDMGVLEVRGERAWAFLQEVCTRDLTGFAPGEGREVLLLDREARYMDHVAMLREDRESFFVLTHPAKTLQVREWFRRISEGYVLFDPEDILLKVQGPVRARDRNGGESQDGARLVAMGVQGQGGDTLWHGESGLKVFRMGGEDRWVLLMKEVEAKRLWGTWGLDPRVVRVDPRKRNEVGVERGWPDERGDGKPEALALFGTHPTLFDLNKPYFAGLWALKEAWPASAVEAFSPPEPPKEARHSCLYEEHAARAKKIATFAGWVMPIWYRSIQEEHQAVRSTAGLFDVTHMGVIGVEGEDAAHFLDLMTTNYVRWLRVDESQYGYLLDLEGRVIDDLMVYRIGPQRFFLVVNASNAEKDLAWLQAVAQGTVSLDGERPGLRFHGEVRVQDLKEPASEEEGLVDVALQGPVSLQVLLRLVAGQEDAWRLKSLKKTQLAKVSLRDIPVWASRTGYTGEQMGFEVFVHPDRAPELWRNILEAGEDLGVVPTGLGARDSLRTEAGLPLYGHELEGPHEIDPLEACFEGYVKLHKPFFVGRKVMVERSRDIQRRVIRFQLLHKGARMLHPGDRVVHRRTQQVMGWVTSAAPNGEGIQVGMALVASRFARPETPVALVGQTHGGAAEIGELEPGKKWPLHEEGVILTRFPERD